MNYRDDFYVPANICGWTGQVHNFPTIYFYRRAPGMMIEFGHITTSHSDEDNEGREEVRRAMNYRIYNDMYQGNLVGHESWGGAVRHYSRNRFYPLRSLRREFWHLLSNLIPVYVDLKETDRKRLYPTVAELAQQAADAQQLEDDVDDILANR